MKLLFLLSLSLLLFANKSSETCFTVQLLSEKDTQENRDYLMSKDYAKGCKIMKIGNNQTVRCGCYKNVQKADKKLVTLYDEYTEAYVTTTYKYRFDDKFKNEPKIKQIVKKKRVQPEINIDTQCYSVEILSKTKTEQNRNYLNAQTFPTSCKQLDFKNKISVRCGCYKDKDSVINEYLRLKKIYKNTIIKISYISKFQKKNVDNQKNIDKIAELEALVKELKNTIKQQEIYIENMDDVEEIGTPEKKSIQKVETKINLDNLKFDDKGN